MSLIKQWIIDQERKLDEDLMFFDADRHHQMEQAMWEAYDEPTNEEEEEVLSQTDSDVPF